MASAQLALGGWPNLISSQSTFASVSVVVFRFSLDGCVKVIKPSGLEGAFSASDTAYEGRRQHIIARWYVDGDIVRG